MNQFKKIALLAALGLASVSAAHAQLSGSDLILGFNDLAGPAAAQNDYVIDLGAASQFTTTSTYSTTFSSSLWASAFGADANALNDVAAGFVQASGGTTYPKTVFVSTGTQTAPTAPTSASFGNATSLIQGITEGVQASSAGANAGSWSSLIAQDPTTAGYNSQNVATYLHTGVESFLSNGTVTEYLYETTKASSLAAGSAYSLIGTLTINANTDTVSFTGASAAVPEPATYGLISGAGMLLLGLRRQFARK